MGVSFKASRVYKTKRNFWHLPIRGFVPSIYYTGPMVPFNVLDYYRKFIEHPEWDGKRKW